ncbi:hypothetical protein TKK_0000417 [Trichogramma kaykai]|uniref:Uncharacterized protein n=1 Tax=Trichogramma kaykai TaxID=54128 RepID=A0ABD2VXT5_9HYME
MTSDGGHEADDEADEDVQSPGDDGATTDDDSERCQDCGHRRPLEISYTIEDLDTLDQRQRQLRQSRSSGGLEVSSDGRRCRSFLSPDDALRDLRKHASQGAEIRWELHSSRSDVGQATTASTTCGCHRSQSTLTPRSHPQRGDLRKHHSAEKDKWSLKPESEHDLRKHLSDDCRMAGSSREPRWTEHLQVPEVHANPRQRCTCAKRLGPVSLSPSPSDETPEDSRRPSLRASRSLSPEDLPQQQQLLQKRPSATDSRSLTPVPQSEQQARTPSPQPQPEAQKANSKASKKDKARIAEERKAMRSKWALKPHFSLPSEPKGHKLWSDKDPKSKSLKERPKYSVRRSLSPDPDPRQVYRLDNRLVRKLISPEVSLVDAKWAPYEGHSPLPNVGMRRRDTKKVVHEIQWQPYESPIHIGKSANAAAPATESSEGPLAYSTLEKQVSIYGAEDPPKPGDEFSSVTPTHLPPPIATPQHGVSSGTDDDDEAFRMRMLNQVSAFPMYQGAWREETPPPSPPAPDLSTPVWAPKPPTPPPVRKQQSVRAVTPSPPPEKRSTFKLRSTSSKKKAAMRAKSQESTRQDKRRSTVKHSTRRADPRLDDQDIYQQQQQQQQQPNQRRRPQLLRSKALLLEAPTMEASKRSLSEEVRPKRRTESSVKRGLYFRAKSEDAARYNPWLSGDEDDYEYDEGVDLEAELREYVTTV